MPPRPTTNPFLPAPAGPSVRASVGAPSLSLSSRDPPRSRRSARRRAVWGGTAVALLLLGGAWTVAVSLSVTPGLTETGGGAYHTTTSLAYLAEVDSGVTTISNSALAVLSPAVGTPTVLAGTSASYALNSLTSSDASQFWVLEETTAAPVNTEVELQFWISTGVVPSVTHLALFVETQATAPGSTLTFTLFYDLGNPGAGTITLNNVLAIDQQCPSLGTCF